METQEKEHSHLADYFKEVIYGALDGIVTTFAVVAGFAGAALSTDTTAQISFVVVLLFGLANLFADAASMGLGNFLSVRSEKDLYNAARRREQKKVSTDPEAEIRDTVTLMMDRGFSQEEATTLANIYRTNEEYWLDFMMTHRLELADPRGENPVYTGLATFTSFVVFGSIPLLPFILMPEGDAAVAFNLSILGTFTALLLLGALKWKVVGTRLWPSLVEVVAVGGTAAVLAYVVGTFFQL